MHLKLINPPNGHQKPIKGGHFHHFKGLEKSIQKNPSRNQIKKESIESRKYTREKLCKNCYNNLSLIEEVLQRNHHYKVTKVPWGPPLQGPLLLSPWLKRGFLAYLLSFLLDIGPPLGLYPLKI